MNLSTVRQFQAAERVAKDAFWAEAAKAKPGSKMTAKQRKLQVAMEAAVKARQTAMQEYAVSLGY